MKFSLYAIVAVLAASVAAEQTLEERARHGNPAKCDKYAKMVPKCARPGIESCTKAAGCGELDYKCGCAKKAQITKCATPKVLKACSTADAEKAQAATNAICKCAK